ncbi:MarR family transcriptional regulator [Paraclostridium benzoelyticum]
MNDFIKNVACATNIYYNEFKINTLAYGGVEMKKYEPLGDLIYFISKELKSRMDESLKDRNLGQGQLLTLMTLFRLKDNDEINQEELARFMGINKANTSRNLNKLKEGGFIVINQSKEDQRKKNIELTNKAFEEFLYLEIIMRKIHNEMISGLDSSSLDCTLSTLIKMKENLCNK